MSAKISLKTTGVKGGMPKWTENTGRVCVFTQDESTKQGNIYFDAFEGQGATYKQRKKALIEVHEDGKILFSGSFAELSEILQGK